MNKPSLHVTCRIYRKHFLFSYNRSQINIKSYSIKSRVKCFKRLQNLSEHLKCASLSDRAPSSVFQCFARCCTCLCVFFASMRFSCYLCSACFLKSFRAVFFCLFVFVSLFVFFRFGFSVTYVKEVLQNMNKEKGECFAPIPGRLGRGA